MDEANARQRPHRKMVRHVADTFLIFSPDEIGKCFDDILPNENEYASLVHDAAAGLQRVMSAGALPFQLTFAAVQQRRFDRMLSAERIRAHASDTSVDEQENTAFSIASRRMAEFIESEDGHDFLQDAVVFEMNRSLRSSGIKLAAYELLAQTIVSTWSVFEDFSSRFIIGFLNSNPQKARIVIERSELRSYFGKQSLDISLIDEHGFDLTRSMGSMIFKDKRLDSLTIIKSLLKALLDDRAVSEALGEDMWLLNQRRHLFVHKRGTVDRDYASKTGDNAPLGERLPLTSSDAERYIQVVERAILAIYHAATR